MPGLHRKASSEPLIQNETASGSGAVSFCGAGGRQVIGYSALCALCRSSFASHFCNSY